MKAEALAAAPPQTAADIILHIFPENIAKSVAEGQVLQVVIFAILFAIGLALTPERPRRVMLEFCESLSEVMFKFTNVVMYFAPLGVGGALAYTVGKMGFAPLLNALQLLLTLYGALIAFVLLVLLPVALLARLPLRRFIGGRGRAGEHCLCHHLVAKRPCPAPWKPWKALGCRAASWPS